MSDFKTGTVEVGGLNDLIPLGPDVVATWAHDQGIKAKRITVLDENGAVQGPAQIAVTQPDENTIVLAEANGNNTPCFVIVDWAFGTVGLAGTTPAGVLVLADGPPLFF